MYHVAAGGLNRKIRPIACQDRQNGNPDYIDFLAARGRSEGRENRVQPANSLQSECFVSRAMTGSELVAVPIFRSCTTFATGC